MRFCLQCLLVCGILGCVIASGPVAVAQTQTDPSTRLPVKEALLKFQHAWGVDLSYNPLLLNGKWTRWVSPEKRSAEDDLRTLLEGTGLSYERSSRSGTFTITALPAASPYYGSLSGYVLDKTTGSRLPRAHVVLVDTERGAATNATGLFSFPALRPGSYILRVTYVGYDTTYQGVEVQPGKHTELFAELRAVIHEMRPIVADGMQGMDQPHPLSATLQEDEINQIKGLGTPDPVRSLNELTGVRVGDAKSDVHIQGGDPGEHQFLLDGGLIFEPVHLFGLLGAFNASAIGRITVEKAGFTASRGSYLAGVINAEHALTDTDQHPIDVQVDPLSFNTRLNLSTGSSEGMRGDLMVAVRTSVWDSYWSNLRSNHIDSLLLAWSTPDQFLMRTSLLRSAFLTLRDEAPILYERFSEILIQRLDSLPPPALPDLAFTDIHAAGRLRFRGGNSLHASYYRGGNQLEGRQLAAALDTTAREIANPDRYKWFNENAQLQWVTLPTPNTLLSTRLRNSRYQLNHEYSALNSQGAQTSPFVEGYYIVDLNPADDGNYIRETALESQLDYVHRNGHFQAGAEIIHTAYRFSIDDVFIRSISLNASPWRAALFAEEKHALLPGVTVTGGTRLTYLQPRKTFYVEPRLEVRYDLAQSPIGAVSLRGATGVYRQFLNQFDMSVISPSALFPSIRFWTPVDSSKAPPKAYHVAGDLLWQPGNGWAVRVESYYKDQPHLLRINYQALWDRNVDEEDPPISTQDAFLESGVGRAYGSAFMVEHTGATVRTSLRYEYNVARREYAFQDSVRLEAVPWSEPQRLEFAVNWTPHPRFIATVRWQGGWGRIWGFRRAYYDFLGTDPTQQHTYGNFDFLEPALHELPSFKQLDLGAAYTQPLGPAALQIRLNVLNATDRENIADQRLVEEARGEDALLVPRNRYMLSRTFSASVRLKW